MLSSVVLAQMPDSLSQQPSSTTAPPTIPTDSTGMPLSRMGADTFSLDVGSVDISSDGIDENIDYNAEDTIFFDIENKKILLWGNATVKYQTMTIVAEHIVIDWENNTMYAEGQERNGQIIGRPNFSEKSTNFDSDRMTYNFKTEKGIIYQAITKQEGMNVVGQKTKFIGGTTDTSRNDVIYSRNAIFTTCDLDHPHFGIRSRKQKVVPDKVVVIGPSNLEIAGVPTPLVLPFGFFPLKQGRRTGLIFPQNYQYSRDDGYGLEGVGWYFPINEYINLQLTSNIYFRGTFGVNAFSQYSRRYRYNGSLRLGYNRQRTEVEGRSVFNPSYGLTWRHDQDRKAHPYQTFGGSIDIQTNNFRSRTADDAASVLQQTLTSTLAYSYDFPGPTRFSASFRHSQNTQTREMQINFPDLNFQTQNIFPFRRKDAAESAQKWYEKISFRYVADVRNVFNTTDSTLFSQQTLDDARYGIRHQVTPNMSFNVLKYFTVNPNINYEEVWYFQTVNKTFDPTNLLIRTDTIFSETDPTAFEIVRDTLRFGKVDTSLVNGFRPLRQFSAGVNVNTQIFGTLLFRKGYLRGLRHVIKPNVGLSFAPDYTAPSWDYFRTVQTDLREEEETQYTIFEQGIFGRPSNGGRRMALTYGFTNVFEAKVFSKRDSTARNIKLIPNLRVGGNYNFAADSLQWSTITMNGQTSLFNSITNVQFNATFDPYDFDPKNGRRINKFYHDRTGKYLRFVNASIRFSSRLTIKKIKDFLIGKDTDSDPETISQPNRVTGQFGRNGPPTNAVDAIQPPVGVAGPGFIDLFENFSINHNFALSRDLVGGRDTLRVTTHTIDTRGTIAISNNWNMSVGNIGYDFQAKRVTYPSIAFSRDLHCWQMGLSWAPQADSYGFFIRVKPGRLDFINVPYEKGRAGRGFGSQFGGGRF